MESLMAAKLFPADVHARILLQAFTKTVDVQGDDLSARTLAFVSGTHRKEGVVK
jgi:hypothetical protein